MGEVNLPSLNDIGTRYDHLRDYAEALDACAKRLEDRGVKTPSDQGKLLKFQIASEVIKSTLDAQSGYNGSSTEYSLYKLLNGIPDKGDQVQGGRGTELSRPYEPLPDKYDGGIDTVSC